MRNYNPQNLPNQGLLCTLYDTEKKGKFSLNHNIESRCVSDTCYDVPHMQGNGFHRFNVIDTNGKHYTCSSTNLSIQNFHTNNI